MSTSASGPRKIRQLNRSAILSHIRISGQNSRLNIGKQLGLSPAAITSVISELLDEKLLKKSDLVFDSNNKKRQGRPILMLELNPGKGAVYGIVLRPTLDKCVIEYAWSDYAGAIHLQEKVIKVKKDNYHSIIEGIENAIKLLDINKPKDIDVFGLCVGVPGVVENQTIPIAPKLACIEDPKFIDTLSELFNFPITYENDVNLGAMSELQKQPRLRNNSFAYLHVYSGVGSSIVLNGQLLRGSRGWAGEIGQLKIPSTRNDATSFEQLLSVDELLGNLLEELGNSRNDVDALVSYLEDNNPKALTAINNYTENLYNVISVIHSVVDLDEVIVDFQAQHLFNILLPKLRTKIATLRHPIKISLPSINQQAYLHGATNNALNLALETIEKRPTNNS